MIPLAHLKTVDMILQNTHGLAMDCYTVREQHHSMLQGCMQRLVFRGRLNFMMTSYINS